MVVVHTATEVLLLKRVDHPNFWQSVTGSLEWGEMPAMAATRELAEETGIEGIALRATGVRRSYSILPEWKKRYPPNTERNCEHLFICTLAQRPDIKIDPQEHSELLWLPLNEAQEKVYSWSNRLALAMIRS